MHPSLLTRVLVASVLGALAASGCAAADAGPPGEASLEVGTGTARFAPVLDGEEVPLVRGAQGGWHLWVSVRATGLDTGVGSLEIEHGPADGSSAPEVSRVGVTFDPPDAQGRRVTLGWQAILPDPSCAVGRLHRVRVTVTTATGQRASAEVDMLPGAGENPPAPCGAI